MFHVKQSRTANRKGADMIKLTPEQLSWGNDPTLNTTEGLDLDDIFEPEKKAARKAKKVKKATVKKAKGKSTKATASKPKAGKAAVKAGKKAKKTKPKTITEMTPGQYYNKRQKEYKAKYGRTLPHTRQYYYEEYEKKRATSEYNAEKRKAIKLIEEMEKAGISNKSLRMTKWELTAKYRTVIDPTTGKEKKIKITREYREKNLQYFWNNEIVKEYQQAIASKDTQAIVSMGYLSQPKYWALMDYLEKNYGYSYEERNEASDNIKAAVNQAGSTNIDAIAEVINEYMRPEEYGGGSDIMAF